ncbi:AsmA family protein [Candidatus Aalborgicola defluviihabitans]|uniref:AsmA family protein n=1 Tax=Candidatus Aalborgicola defluviihabitans TaxID=3386187 RepID=UPI001ED5E545|nr:AsmA family protein [Burkholderiales bacterium]
MTPRLTKPLLVLLLAPGIVGLLVVLGIALFGWNWARAPIQQGTLAQTGRALVIAGDLKLHLDWPFVRVESEQVSFANPPWAAQPKMLVADAVEFSVDLRALWNQHIVLQDVRLKRPIVMLETASDGRKSWLLDSLQRDGTAQVAIARLTLDHGQLELDDSQHDTHIHLSVDTKDTSTGSVAFKANGKFQGLPLVATGTSASVLTLRDEQVPFPLTVDAKVGPTALQAHGTLTGLFALTGLDMQIALRGGSLAQLFPLLGLGLPETHAYAMIGRLVHDATTWRFEQFSGTVGHSDVAGTLETQRVNERPMLRGNVTSQVMDLGDLAPVIGAGPSTPHEGPRQVLPDNALKADRWKSFNADVTFNAVRIERAKALPLDQLKVRIRLQDAVLTLDPLDFVAAGGHLQGVIVLDARQPLIRASATVQVKKLLLGALFPTLDLTKTSVGELNGEVRLKGQGNSVKHMLASSDGAVHLEMGQGKISRLLMEQAGLHLLEILKLRIAGDKNIVLRCALADFRVQQGIMQTQQLLLDTDVSTVVGSGSVNLALETLDLTLVPHTRTTSLVALRSPIYIRGTFDAPKVTLDTASILARSAGAVALGLLNPVLALIPLVEKGPGRDQGCAQASGGGNHD